MPISANKLIYDLRRKVNAIDSGRSKDYRIVDLVSFINDAYSIIISHLIQEKDENETIRNHLRPLMVVNKKLKCKKTNDCNICEIIYPDNFYELDDIDVASRNPYRQANYYFEQLLCYETNKGLRFYHNNEMDILSIEIDYYRKIKGIEAPKLVECEDHIYKNWDGELIKNNVDFEIDSTYLANKVTDVAAALMNNASTNFVGFNEKLKEILQINQLHK
jgi:hypothetical protein